MKRDSLYCRSGIFSGLARESFLFYAIAFIILPIMAFSAYSNTFNSPLILDDYHSFIDEPKIYIDTFDRNSLLKLSETKFGLKRYLPLLTFSLDHLRGRGRLSVYHFTNLTIHIFAYLMLLFLISTLFKVFSIDSPKQTKIPNLDILIVFVSGMWLLCPVQTNAVTYVVQRMTALMSLFYFLSVAAYLFARIDLEKRQKTSLKSMLFFAVSLMSAVMAFLSKENSAMLPLMLFVSELLFFRSTRRKLRTWLGNRRIMVVLSLVSVLVFVFGYKFLLPGILDGYASRHFSWSERLMTEARVVVTYFSLLLLPLPSRLNLEHDVIVSTGIFSPPTTFFSIIFIVGMVSAAYWMPERQTLLKFGLAWFFMNLVIESSIVPLELMFEHRLYLPSVGIFIILGITVFSLIKKIRGNLSDDKVRKILISIVLLVFSGLTLLTYQRNVDWRSSVSIYRDCAEKAPLKARNYAGLSKAYSSEGKYEEAIAAAEQAISLSRKNYEEYWAAACNLLAAEISVNGYLGAIARGEALLAGAPKEAKRDALPFFLGNLGIAYFKVGEYEKAISTLNDSLRYSLLFKDQSATVKTMARLFLAHKKLFEENKQISSNQEFEKCANEYASLKLTDVLIECCEFERALNVCRAGLSANGENSQLKARLENIEKTIASNNLQKDKGTLQEKYFFKAWHSSSHFMMGLIYFLQKYNFSLDPLLAYCFHNLEEKDVFPVDFNLLYSWYFFKKNDYLTALQKIEAALSLDPFYAQLWVNKGMYLLAMGERDKAGRSLKRALELFPAYPQKNKVLAMIQLVDSDGEVRF
ncbi:MAG TPA: tetratricopeptide repeat protein [Proteobacteria bacterium]|nr:tetratricopeptide repeat protein [Pseudomonadota bacterium]